MSDLGALDFAGGTVVHINAGIAGLVLALVLGKRIGYGKEAMYELAKRGLANVERIQVGSVCRDQIRLRRQAAPNEIGECEITGSLLLK